MVAAAIAEMVGKAVTLTSLGGLKRKRPERADRTNCTGHIVSLPAYLAAPLDSIKQAWLGRTSESGQEYRVSRHNIFGMRGNGEEET